MMVDRIYIIEQLENADSNIKRWQLLRDMPFAVLLTYKPHIEQILRARADGCALEYLRAALCYLRATGRKRSGVMGVIENIDDDLMGDV